MKVGLFIRNMGPASAPAILADCARAAEDASIDDLWVADHVAIPPDDAEGSDGRYMDPLATLAFLSAITDRIGLGTGVLVLPYRPPLVTAKWMATIQELSAGRLLCGVGVGWMQAEFRALAVPHGRRGRIADETLAFIDQCFGADEVEAHGQPFLFRPRPPKPPVLVAGSAKYAFPRILRHGDGWMPIGMDAEALRPRVAELRAAARDSGRRDPEIVVVTSLPLDDPASAAAGAQAFAEAGATGIVHGSRYEDRAGFEKAVEVMAHHVMPAVAAT